MNNQPFNSGLIEEIDSLLHQFLFFSEKYWMPFLAKHSSTMAGDLKFSPPLDIHWVWHVHMLAPVQYNKDCTATVDRMLGIIETVYNFLYKLDLKPHMHLVELIVFPPNHIIIRRKLGY